MAKRHTKENFIEGFNNVKNGEMELISLNEEEIIEKVEKVNEIIDKNIKPPAPKLDELELSNMTIDTSFLDDGLKEIEDYLVKNAPEKIKQIKIRAEDAFHISSIEQFQLRYKEITDEMIGQTQTLGSVMADNINGAVNSMASALERGASSFKEYGKNVKSAVKDIISSLLAQTVATMISNAIKTAGFSGPLALAVAPALAAAGAGIARTAFNSLVPAFKDGTNFAPGGLSLVGEEGAELVNLPRGSQVKTNKETEKI
ncbi:MAG: hypothetical protein ACOC3V_04240, partial [bacterium]